MNILDALLNIIRDKLPEEALTQDPATRDHLLDVAYIDNDEVNLTQLAKELETAISIKRD